MKILVTGLIRDGAHILYKEITRLKNALSDTDELHFLIVESDSNDKTIEVLERLKSQLAHFKYQSLGKLQDRISTRTKRIAHCRNIYLKEIRENPNYRSIDFVIVADLDGTNHLLSKKSFASCWKTLDSWDVCTANQDGPYYDLWALRHKHWCPQDCYKDLDALLSIGIPRHKALWAAIYSKMFTIPPDTPLIPIDSAFGGLAIYKREVLIGDFFYDGDDACEHVSFHQKLRAKSVRIMLNPALINCGINEHNKKATFPYKFYFQLDGPLLKLAQIFVKTN